MSMAAKKKTNTKGKLKCREYKIFRVGFKYSELHPQYMNIITNKHRFF